MWIKSQDKKTLVNVVAIRKYVSGKHYGILGTMKSQTLLNNERDLGRYKTEEALNEDFNAIEECLIKSENFYAMK